MARMGVVSWLALVLVAVAYRNPTVSAVGSAKVVDTVIIKIAVGRKVNSSIIDQVTSRASHKAAVYSITGDPCLKETQLKLKKTEGLIYITKDSACASSYKSDSPSLVLIEDATPFNVKVAGKDTIYSTTGNTTGLDRLLYELAGLVVANNKPKKNLDSSAVPVPINNKPTKNLDSSAVPVPIWAIIAVGVLVGVSLAGNCILFSKMRGAARTRTHPASDKKSGKSSGSKREGGSSKRSSSVKKQKKKKASSGSSSRSGRSASSSKVTKKPSNSPGSNNSKVSCRLSKSLSTKKCNDSSAPTSVKVISVGPPRAESKPSPKDEVAIAMMSRASLPERSLDRRIEMPMNEEEFMVAMKKVIEFVIEFYRNPTKWPVSTAIRPNDIFNQLPQRAPENPEGFDLVWHDFHEIILRGFVQWQHPQFHAFFPCGRSYPDILAETVISSLGTVGFTWSANPAITELDTAMVNWMGRALGIPECFLFRGLDTCASDGGGWIADTASDAIFCAIMAARHTKVEQEIAKQAAIEEDTPMTESIRHTSKKYAKRAEIMSKLVAYGSYESHSSFEKACKLACVRCRPIKVFEENDWGMKRKEVEKEMEKDRQRGLIPFYLHVALGTTSTATSDHLSELTPLKEKYNVWIHVDAAYAGSAWVVEKYRKNTAGLDKVDSININLHKFFLASTSVTLFWTRRQREYKECFRVDPSYLKKKTGATDLRDWGIQLSRRFKSLKVYMLLRMYGLNGMRAYVTRVCEMTEYMESLITKLPNIRKFGKTNYGLFCVQYAEPGWSKEQINHATNRLCEFMNNSHKIVLTHSNVRGHDILRVCVTLERSSKKDIHDSVAIFTQLVEEFRKKKDENSCYLKVDMSSTSREKLQDVDMGIIGSPNPTLSRTPTTARSVVSTESLVGPRTANAPNHSAITSATQETTLAMPRPAASPLPLTNIEAIKTVQLSVAAPAAPAAPAAAPAVAPASPATLLPAANKMPPLPPAFDKDPSSKTGGTSSYNAPASVPPLAAAAEPPAAKPAEHQVEYDLTKPTYTAPEVTARSDLATDKK